MNKFEGLYLDITEGKNNIDLCFQEICSNMFGTKGMEDLIIGLTYIDAGSLTIDMDFSSPARADSKIFNYIVYNEDNFQNAGFAIKYFETGGKDGVILSWPQNKNY